MDYKNAGFSSDKSCSENESPTKQEEKSIFLILRRQFKTCAAVQYISSQCKFLCIHLKEQTHIAVAFACISKVHLSLPRFNSPLDERLRTADGSSTIRGSKDRVARSPHSVDRSAHSKSCRSSKNKGPHNRYIMFLYHFVGNGGAYFSGFGI